MRVGASSARTSSDAVVWLEDAGATIPRVVGTKAAHLARAASLGFPVLPGFVITTATSRLLGDGTAPPGDAIASIMGAWHELSSSTSGTVIVRSSSPLEDGARSSMAGMFSSVLHVKDAGGVIDAVRAIARSGAVGDDLAMPVAAIVQPMLEPACSGVMFGADPLTGRLDRILVDAVPRHLGARVGGRAQGRRLVLARSGRLIDGDADGLIGRPQRRALAALARRAADAFGGPQDIEWAFDADGELWLLQTRPITAIADAAPARGPVFGPGPVAETFPEPLSRLEEDLWLQPLRDGLREALTISGTSRRRLARSPVVISVGGRAAVDLSLFGIDETRRSPLRRLDPRPSMRKLRAAWRVGRLRAILPRSAAELCERVDDRLAAISSLENLSDEELNAVLRGWCRQLMSLHAHEILAGLLLRHPATGPTAAGASLRALGTAPASDRTELLARHPVLLSLTPPRIGRAPTIPEVAGPLTPGSEEEPDGLVLTREMLRLRARWVQELLGRAALAAGERLARRGVLARPIDVRRLGLGQVVRGIDEGRAVEITPSVAAAPPLPARFRVSGDGRVIAVDPQAGRHGGRGAGGGRGVGPVRIDRPAPGAVLVVAALDPSLAPSLPTLAGLVSESGSALSHLAIVAREHGVPTVVGLHDARRRFPEGVSVVVDGSTGEVATIEGVIDA